jgi:ankyrin repeat protein
MPVSNDSQLSASISTSFESKSSQTLIPQTPEPASSTRKAPVRSEENDPIVSRYVPIQCSGEYASCLRHTLICLPISFIRLGDLRMTLQNVENWLHSTSTNIPQGYRSSSDAKAETALEFTSFCVKDRYSTEVQNLLSLAEPLELGRAESVLRRALDAVDQFLAIVQSPISPKAATCNAVITSKIRILNKLASISEGKGDFPEVERLLEILSRLSSSNNIPIDPDISSRLAESYTRTSQRMQHLLDDLPIPLKYRNSLHLQGNGPFPPIHRALLDQNPPVVQQLCNKTRQLDKQVDILGRQPLHIVAETSNLGLLNLVHVDAHNLPETRDLCRRTPLCVAAYIGNLAFFEKLFGASADVESRDEEGRSVLGVACAAGHLPIVQFLLENNVSPNDDNFGDCSPLHAAASAGHLNVCKALLEAGAYSNTYMLRSPAQVAMEAGHDDVANLIEEFAGRTENLFLASVDGSALNDTSAYPQISQPEVLVQHFGDVPSSPIQRTPAGRRLGTDSAEDTEAYEFVDF